MKFLVPNYSCLQNPWLRGYRPQIPILSDLCPQLNLLNPPRKKFLGTPLQCKLYKFDPTSYKYTTCFGQVEKTIRYTNTKILAWGKYRASMYKFLSCTKTPCNNRLCVKKLKILHKLLLLMFLFFLLSNKQHIATFFIIQSSPQWESHIDYVISILLWGYVTTKKNSTHVLQICFHL